MATKRFWAITLCLAGTPLWACGPEDLSSVALNDNVDFSTQIQPIFNNHCSGCHIGGSSGGLSLAIGSAHANLVGVAANNGNAGIPRVTAGNPATSFLFRKLNCTGLNGLAGTPFGLRMPRNGPPYLSAAQQALVHDWIREGATTAADPDRIWRSGLESRAAIGPFPPTP